MTRHKFTNSLKANWAKLDKLHAERIDLFATVARDDFAQSSDIDKLIQDVRQATFDAYIDVLLLHRDILDRVVDLITPKSPLISVTAQCGKRLDLCRGISPRFWKISIRVALKPKRNAHHLIRSKLYAAHDPIRITL